MDGARGRNVSKSIESSIDGLVEAEQEKTTHKDASFPFLKEIFEVKHTHVYNLHNHNAG